MRYEVGDVFTAKIESNKIDFIGIITQEKMGTYSYAVIVGTDRGGPHFTADSAFAADTKKVGHATS